MTINVGGWGLGLGRIMARAERPGVKNSDLAFLVRFGGRWGFIAVKPSWFKGPGAGR